MTGAKASSLCVLTPTPLKNFTYPRSLKV
jgi:hypothetical protein